MGDENGGGSKDKAIPVWQHSTISTGPKPDSSEATAIAPAEQEQPSTSDSPSPVKNDPIEQGRRFLLDDSVKTAPADQKITFLKSKGLTEADIEKAFALAGEPMSSARPTSMASQTDTTVLKTPPTSSPQQLTSQTQATSQTQPSSSADITPIITYPEFLVHSRKPPPLVTTSLLMNTAYAASAVTALFYGCSKYLISPMRESLTESRHDLAQHAAAKLDVFNIRLRDVVSRDPQRLHPAHILSSADTDMDTASVDSDPTELFHRDFGTQTSPSLLDSVTGLPFDATSSEESDEENMEKRASSQALKLQQLANSARALSQDEIFESGEDRETLAVLKVLHEYLESLAYPLYSTPGGYNVIGSSQGSKDTKKEDEMSRFKAEIRSVKGTLLSARNFPSSNSASVIGRRTGAYAQVDTRGTGASGSVGVS